jgi:RNA polymerase sigma-70 factor (ECF subfamily)
MEADHHMGAAPENGRMLLDALARQGGHDAVARAVVEHADMVYATCRRILGNEAEAADVAQETFFHLLKNFRRLRGSIGAWLHHVATSRSIDLLRRNTSRRRREEAYVMETAAGPDTWREVEPIVDEALEALPTEAREILVEHCLQRWSMAEIGRKRGLSQPTASRRVAAALEELRDRLRGQGLLAGTGGLGALFSTTVESTPAPLLQGLGKMVLAHAASGASGTAATAWSSLAGGAKTVALWSVALGLAVVGYLALKPRRAAPPPVVTNTLPVTTTFGFSTSVVWTTGPGGRGVRVVTSGTNFAVTNYGGLPNRAAPLPPGR